MREKRWNPERIRALRQRLGMSQEEFADAVGVTSGVSVSRWERGQNGPDRRCRKVLDELDAAGEG